MELQIKQLCVLLSSLGVTHEIYNSGTSNYVKVSGFDAVKQIRFSNHEGRKVSKKSWQVRTDRETSRASNIFNIKDVKTLMSLILKKHLKAKGIKP